MNDSVIFGNCLLRIKDGIPSILYPEIILSSPKEPDNTLEIKIHQEYNCIVADIAWMASSVVPSENLLVIPKEEWSQNIVSEEELKSLMNINNFEIEWQDDFPKFKNTEENEIKLKVICESGFMTRMYLPEVKEEEVVSRNVEYSFKLLMTGSKDISVKTYEFGVYEFEQEGRSIPSCSNYPNYPNGFKEAYVEGMKIFSLKKDEVIRDFESRRQAREENEAKVINEAIDRILVLLSMLDGKYVQYHKNDCLPFLDVYTIPKHYFGWRN